MLKFPLKEGKYIKSNAWKFMLVAKEKLITRKYRVCFDMGCVSKLNLQYLK